MTRVGRASGMDGRQIVGVVGDFKNQSGAGWLRDVRNALASSAPPTMFVPVAQLSPDMLKDLHASVRVHWIVRTRQGATAVVPAVEFGGLEPVPAQPVPRTPTTRNTCVQRYHRVMTAHAMTVAAALLAWAALQVPARPTTAPPSRVVAVGDVHGGYGELVRVLQDVGVIDGRRQWAGGRTQLVQTGDVVDRGPHSRRVLDLLMTLERQATKTGGRVHALLGNHEVMNVAGDLRYVSPEEFAAFRTPDSDALRDAAFEKLADPIRRHDAQYREAWEAQRPLGWVEHRLAFGSDGKYGRWLRQRNAVVLLDDVLFVHGGLSPKYAETTADSLNASIRAELSDATRLVDGVAFDVEGPLWYRGLALEPEEQIAPHVDRLLAHHGVGRIVVGHTVTPGAILPRLGGKVLMIDVGLSEAYGSRQACLVLEQGFAFARHRGTRLPVPSGAGLLGYLEAAAALDPAPSPLLPLIANAGRFPMPQMATPPP